MAKISPQTDSLDKLRHQMLMRLKSNRNQRIESFINTGALDTNVVDTGYVPSSSSKNSPRPDQELKPRTWYDRVLIGVEILAVLMLAVIIINALNLVQNLNQEFAAALAQPALTPTPLISAVVLPSGHTFSEDGSGIPLPNESEVPEHLRPIVQAMAEIPIPTQSPQHAVRIQINSIDVDAPIVQGDGWEQLKKGVGQHIGSPNPSDGGNLILSAHNDIYGELFRDLDQLEPGDTIKVFTNQITYEYVVVQTQIVDPTFTEVLNQTNQSIITLISCYPYGVNNQRIVITGQRK
jgi:sortase A